MATTLDNMADQALDIAGTLYQTDNLIKSDEPLQLGKPIQLGAIASISGIAPNITISGLLGITSQSVGHFITIENASSINNNGTFQIIQYLSPSSIIINNSLGVGGDLNNGSIYWIERFPWSAEDDHNFHRTDRADIKGVGYDQPVPTYIRCVDQDTPIPANLLNIAGKTTDAKAFVDNLKFSNLSVNLGNSFITLNSPGNLKHADAINITGVPINDGYDSGNNEATFVGIIKDGYGTELTVLRTIEGGVQAGWRIYGITRAGSSISPNSVEIEFRAVEPNGDLDGYLPYTWEVGQINTIHIIIGYRTCLYNLSEVAFRKTLIYGSSSDELPTPNGIGQILMAIDGTRFIPAMPVTSIQGWLVNDEGILIVNDIYGEVE
jgi:hypothetical protein